MKQCESDSSIRRIADSSSWEEGAVAGVRSRCESVHGGGPQRERRLERCPGLQEAPGAPEPLASGVKPFTAAHVYGKVLLRLLKSEDASDEAA